MILVGALVIAILFSPLVDFIVQNTVEVLEKVSLKDLPRGPSMFADILADMARGEKKNESDKSINKDQSKKDRLCTMRISHLRRKVIEKGLEIDGSRETLIATLKENS